MSWEVTRIPFGINCRYYDLTNMHIRLCFELILFLFVNKKWKKMGMGGRQLNREIDPYWYRNSVICGISRAMMHFFPSHLKKAWQPDNSWQDKVERRPSPT